jgi:putative salt-induced outer membrane protein YdiY
VNAPIAADGDGKVEVAPTPGAPPQLVEIKDISAINYPSLDWTGRIRLNGLFTTGNSETSQIGFGAALGKRWPDDALSFAAEYSYGRQKDQDTGVSTTTVDYAMGLGRYEHYFTKKFYGYGQVKIEHDGVAGLNIRVAPGAGAGYQWFEGPTFNLKTEAGLVWIYEDYETTGSRSYLAARLAYYVDWVPVEPLTLFHSLEYMPSFDDPTGKYLLNIDAGLRAKMWKDLFGEFKIEYRYNSAPEPGRKTTDVRYIVGAGWQF